MSFIWGPMKQGARLCGKTEAMVYAVYALEYVKRYV